MINKEIGDKIQLFRVQAKLTQHALADKAGISQSHLSDLEKGGDIKWSELEKIASSLNISVSKLLPASTISEVNNTSNDESQQTNYNGVITISCPKDMLDALIDKSVKEAISRLQ
jgi:transcriptional regulator with XRE-family HTH domain